MSLDGRWAFAYGINDLTRTKLGELKETPAADEGFDRKIWEAFDEVEGHDLPNFRNYLVDQRSQRIVGVIPGFRFYPGRNHQRSLEVGWSVDGREALAIYPARYCYAAVAWIEPQTGRMNDVGRELEVAFRRVLARREGGAYTRHAEDYAVSFFDPIVPGPGQFIMGWAEANMPRKDMDGPDFDYRLQFKVVKRKGKPHFILVSAQRGGDCEYDQPLDDPEAELANAFHRLRARLLGAARIAFEREQAKWKGLIEAMPNRGERYFYTQRRARELDLRRKLL